MARNKQDTIILSFSKKNSDVKDIIEDKRSKNIVITDYICECIRYYEKHSKEPSINEKINEVVKSTINDMIFSGNFVIPVATDIKETTKKEEVTKEEGYSKLEDISSEVFNLMNLEDD